jgi:hypothetical protein
VRDFVRICTLKAELTDAITFASGDGWSKDTTGLRSRGVEIAGAVFGVKCGTGLVIGELIEVGDGIPVGVYVEGAGGRVSRKIGGEARPGCSGTLQDASGTFGIGRLEFSETTAQPKGVRRTDGEGSYAALDTSRAAEEMGPAPLSGIGECAIHKSNERAVPGAKVCVGVIRSADAPEAHGVMVELPGTPLCDFVMGTRGPLNRGEWRLWVRTSDAALPGKSTI